jgi:hypothetical protein
MSMRRGTKKHSGQGDRLKRGHGHAEAAVRGELKKIESAPSPVAKPSPKPPRTTQRQKFGKG